MIKIIDKVNVQITYETDRKVLEQTWLGFTSSEEFREAIDKSLEFARSKDVRFLLSNALNHKPIKPEDERYAANAIPHFKAAGVRKLVFVIPERTIVKLGVKKFTSLKGGEIDIAHFSNMDDARVWFSQVS